MAEEHSAQEKGKRYINTREDILVIMAKQKFPEADNRIFQRVFICMKCGARMRTDLIKVRDGKARCRKCKRKQLRPIKKEHKV